MSSNKHKDFVILSEMLATFPDFTPITLEDKEDYRKLMAEYPPISDIEFATLHIWWNLESKLAASSLNGNLILHYSQPFDRENSGYCLIGTQLIDETIEAVFDYLRHEHKPVKLVHVPEFVIKNVKQPEKWLIEEEPDYHEYILDSRALATLEGHDHWRTRGKIKRFLREVEGRQVEVRSEELTSQESKDDLLRKIIEWESTRKSTNDTERTEHEAIKKTLAHATHLDIENISLYIDGKLHGVAFYHKSADNKYFIIHHIKVDYGVHRIFDYMTHMLATHAKDNAVDFINMEMDLGIASLREHKLGLRPVDFFRKYTVKPARS